MTRTVGFGITTSFGLGVENAIQRAFVRDGQTGQWYFVETLFSGLTAGAIPLDGSLDSFVLSEGLSPSDLAGTGYFSYVSSIASTGLVLNSAGEVIGVQGGLVTNVGYGLGTTVTTVIPIEQAGDEIVDALGLPLTAALIGLMLFGPYAALAAFAFGFLFSPLLNVIYDPLILDLDGDGIELSSLEGSTIHFDYDGDGFAERTGWVSADDGLLAFDANANGTVDGISELFGSPSQDGFAVLETFDTNGDGKIDASDTIFGQLRVWRDLDQDGVSDAGELMTLAEAGIASISLTRTEVTGTNAGHEIGYQALYTSTNGSTGAAQTVYFQTDRQDTRGDNTPGFTPAVGVDKLPQLPGSGQINSIAWKATQDATFRADWTTLTDNAATLSPDELRASFENLILRWAGVDTVVETSRGQYVDARHLAFVEKFFGETYKEFYVGQQVTTSPTRQTFGDAIEVNFDQIVDAMLTAFLAQSVGSSIARGADITEALESPYFFYALLDFRSEWPVGVTPPETPGNIGMVLELVKSLMPENPGESAEYLAKTMSGLNGIVSIAFENDRAAYVTATSAVLSTITDSNLRLIATEIVKGTAALGSEGADGLLRGDGDNVYIGGKGDDFLVSGAGSDLFLYSRGGGTDYIRDTSTSTVEADTLFLTDIAAGELAYERIGDNLIIKISGTTEKIIAEQFFADWGIKNRSIDQIRFSDGSTINREGIRSQTITVGNQEANLILDSALNDVLRGGRGHDEIRLSTGSDTIHYAAGDGFDLINDTSGIKSEVDTLALAGLMPSDIQLSRAGNALLIRILSTGEVITDTKFFTNSANPTAADGWNNKGWGIDAIRFENGIVWDRQTLAKEAWIRGNEKANGLAGSGLNDTFDGGKGNDTFDGGAGSDVYHWKKGDGSDTIVDISNSLTDVDKLIFTDVHVSGVTFSYAGNDLLITVRSTEEVIRITDFFGGADNLIEDWDLSGYGLEQITFAGGTKLDREDIFLQTGIDFLGKEFSTRSLYINGIIQWSYFEDEFGNTGAIVGAPPMVGPHRTFVDLDDEYDVYSADSVFELWGHNSIDGRGGDDILVGGSGSDAILGGDGDDHLFGDEIALPWFIQTPTTWTLEGAWGNDSLFGEKGNDILFGGKGNDSLSGGEGADELYGADGADYLVDSSIEGDIFNGGKGDDIIASAHSLAIGGGDNGGDTFLYRLGDGNDIILDGSSSPTETDRLVLVGIDSDEVELSFGGEFDLVVRMLETNETITNYGFFRDWNWASRGFEQIEFADGVTWNRATIRQHAEATWLRGSTTRDFIQDNGLWAQTFHGGLGDDVIVSALTYGSYLFGYLNGNDTFVYGRGDGNDVIFDGSHSLLETDRLVLTDIDDDEVELSRVDLALVVRDLVTGQTIVNEGFFYGTDNTGQGFEVIEFANGVVWDRQDLLSRGWYRGGVTNDTLQSSERLDETFVGGLGDDMTISAITRSLLFGNNNGNDTFIYNLGDGNDLIFDSAYAQEETDTLVLNGISPQDLALSISGNDLHILVLSTGHTIIDEGQFWVSYRHIGIDRVEFSNGTVWNREDIRYWAQEGSAFYAGTSNNDTLIGSSVDQRLSGGNGDDFIDGKAGSDLIFGDAGNDTLALSVAESGDVDELDGGAGTDTATFENFASAIWVDLVENQGEARTSDGPVLGTGDLRLVATLRGLENVTGTVGNDEISGDALNNRLVGGAGDDLLEGRSGDDVLAGGLGSDVVDGYLGNDTFEYARGDGDDTVLETAASGGTSDKIRLYNVDPAKVTFARAGGNLVIQIAETTTGAGDGGSITLVGPQTGSFQYDEYGIEILEFDGGVVWNKDALRQRSVSDSATDGDDNLVGTAGLGVINGRKGNDTISGGGGEDIYVYARGDGHDTLIEIRNGGANDTLQFTDINPAAVTLTRNGTDVTVVIAESAPGASDGGSVLIKTMLDEDNGAGVDRIVFADGTVWTRAILRLVFLDQAGTSGNDTITGFNVADTIRGRGGNDSLNGGQIDDIYIYARGDGNDTITEANGHGGNDTLQFTDITPAVVTLVRNGNDVTVVIAESAPGAGDGGSVLLKAALDDVNGTGVDRILFADTTVWTRANLRTMLLDQAGTSGSDTITGFNVADTIRGRGGNDNLNGMQGDDTYIYARGDGNDTITEVRSNGFNDTLQFTDINAAAVTLVRNGTDVTLVIAESAPGAGDGGSVLLKTTLDEDNGVGLDRIVFADGTIWTRANLRTMLLDQAGTSGSDTIIGFSVADVIRGRGGNDNLNGMQGDDVYIYARGDGNDTITEARSNGINDTLQFTDINAAAVTLVRNGTDVTVVIAESAPGAGDGGSVLLKTTLDEDNGVGLDRIVFADGTIWTRANLRTMLLDQAGTSGNDTITGFNVADTFRGRGGNDSLNGGQIDDVYIYARGDGNDTITEARSNGINDTLQFTDINAAAVTLVRNGTDVTVVIAESAPGAGDGGSVLLKTTLDEDNGVGLDRIVFADGTIWTRANLRTMLLDQAGTSGNDTIAGFNVADTIRGRGGNDSLNGGQIDDVYIYARGDGNDTITEARSNGINDTLQFTDINAAAVTLVRNGTDVTLVIAESAPGAGDGGSVLLKTTLDEDNGVGLDRIVFADGTIWTRANLRTMLLDQAGTSGNDTIAGFNVADTIRGRGGNDNLNGMQGDDVYIYARGDGNDTITEANGHGGNDTLQFTDINPAAVTLVRNGTDVTVVIAESAPGAGDGGSVLLKAGLDTVNGTGVDKIVFANGTVWTKTNMLANVAYVGGTSGNDTITGSSSADLIVAGAGDDVIVGGAGNDTFIFKPDFGNDTINDFVVGAGSADVFEIDNDIFADFAAVLAAASQVGSDTLITYDVDNTILLKNVAMTNLHQDDFRFIAA